jgi:hypothetical protein
MKLLCANVCKSEYLCFLGHAKVATVHIIASWHFPIVRARGIDRPGHALRSEEQVRAWILMTLKEMGAVK